MWLNNCESDSDEEVELIKTSFPKIKEESSEEE